MARSNLKPVSVAGIEFDALIEEQKTLSATIPVYPVEDGFPVSDTIILEPVSVSMTLYVSNTPVTWLYRHGTSNSRVNNICNRMEELWLSRQLVKIVTTDTVYTNMGLTSISIKHSKEIGYAREISLTAQKIRVTSRKTASIPSYILKAGETMANAGTASTSTTSSSAGTASGSTGGSSGSSGSSGGSGGSSGSSGGSSAKKNQSILYGVASGLGFI
ncbi:MAG: hypothetical protein K1W25_15380 [Lachnospiraceae bacterium]